MFVVTLHYEHSSLVGMALVVLVLWLVQAAVGVTLFVSWLRHAHGRGARTVVTHVVSSLTGLAFWIWFVATGALAPAWIAFVVITIGNGFGDVMLLQRARRLDPAATTTAKAYRVAVSGAFRGALPPRVSFHAIFSGVVYFSCLGVCIGATIAG